MSGIAGVYYLDGQPVKRADLEPMVSILAHRGPDGAGLWVEGSVGLGHRMLHTTPESLHETLPVVSRTGDLVLTADARIDNRAELIDALRVQDQSPITDSQLILAAYDKWGEHCPEKLEGDFAFALWDGPKQRLFCARDHFGVRPFYYYRSDRLFAFGSEVKALFGLTEVPRRLNETRVAEYLASMFDNTAITFYQDVLRLPPAHSIKISREGAELQTYWSLDPSRELRLDSDEAYAEAFRELFTKAVHRRLRSAFPVGSLLSGGLDSSSVTCMARRLLTHNGEGQLKTFSAVFDEVTQCDERSYIDAVLAQGGVEPYHVHGDQMSPLVDLDRVLWHQDEALYSFNLFLNWGLCDLAKKQGVRVLLDGFDGDTTVSHGVGYLPELARRGQWLALAVELRGFARNFGQPFTDLLWGYVRRYGLDPLVSKSRILGLLQRILRVLMRPIQRLFRPSSSRSAKVTVLNPDFAQRIDLRGRQQRQGKQPRNEREFHYQTLTSGVMPFTLEVLDRACAAFCIEPRYPFWDKRLVEFCLSLPPGQKIYQGWTRVVLRRAMEGILPAAVQWRRDKSNLGPNFCHTLLAFERKRLDSIILENLSSFEDYLNPAALREAYHRFLSQKAVDEDVIEIWKATTLALWLEFATLQSTLYEGGDAS